MLQEVSNFLVKFSTGLLELQDDWGWEALGIHDFSSPNLCVFRTFASLFVGEFWPEVSEYEPGDPTAAEEGSVDQLEVDLT